MQFDENMAQQLWDSIVIGIVWMFTIKYPGESDFAFWIFSWTLIILMSIPIFTKIFQKIRDNLD